jgi:D-alanyl-D-alanine carboxypeptidase
MIGNRMRGGRLPARHIRCMRAVFGGKVVPPKQQKEMDACLDQDRRADRGGVAGRPRGGFSQLGGADSRASRHAMVLRGLVYVWIPDQDLMITVQTNGTDNLGDAVNAIYDIVKRPKAD